jgi:hypothetical protein
MNFRVVITFIALAFFVVYIAISSYSFTMKVLRSDWDNAPEGDVRIENARNPKYQYTATEDLMTNRWLSLLPRKTWESLADTSYKHWKAHEINLLNPNDIQRAKLLARFNGWYRVEDFGYVVVIINTALDIEIIIFGRSINDPNPRITVYGAKEITDWGNKTDLHGNQSHRLIEYMMRGNRIPPRMIKW